MIREKESVDKGHDVVFACPREIGHSKTHFGKTDARTLKSPDKSTEP
jgi:hypothetical protein